MFVAWRDLIFARGRFVLIGSVVTLITLLVGFLSGLTAGLANQNISTIQNLDADRIVFSKPAAGAQASFSDSAIDAAQLKSWEGAPGVKSAEPIGITQTKAQGSAQASVSLFGVQPDFGSNAPSKAGQLVLSAPAADEMKAAAGDKVTISGSSYTVDKVVGDDWFSHTAVVWMNLNDWQNYAKRTGEPDAFATVLAVKGSTDAERLGDTVATTKFGSQTAIGAFSSEIGSLLMMVGMLFGISALVIGAFFTVWTIQRKGDVAVLKALGASNGALVKDALGQALVVLVLGVGIGIGLTALLGLLAGQALPFILSPFTTILPATAMVVLGLAGAAFALRSVTSADPLTALGNNR